jgi:ubiquinone/menaquinone biosynthesis C-methylase UbiE
MYYDYDYFENGPGSGKGDYTDYSWERLGAEFQKTAAHIIRCFKPVSSLDIGCAKGFLVKSLRESGVDAYGIDISPYALANAPFDTRDYVRFVDVTKMPFPDNMYELVTALDVLEHIPEPQVYDAIKEIARVASKYVVISVPCERFNDKSHVTLYPIIWWVEKFEDCGLFELGKLGYMNNDVWWFNVPHRLAIFEKRGSSHV